MAIVENKGDLVIGAYAEILERFLCPTPEGEYPRMLEAVRKLLHRELTDRGCSEITDYEPYRVPDGYRWQVCATGRLNDG